MKNYLLKDKIDIVKNYSKDLLDRLNIIFDDLPIGANLNLYKELDFFRIESSEKNEQKLLYTMILLNYMSHDLNDLVNNFNIFKNIKIDTTILTNEDIKNFINASLYNNSYDSLLFALNTFDNNICSKILNTVQNNNNSFLSYCRNPKMDIRILELIEKNQLVDFNKINCYGKEYALMDIIGNKRNKVFSHTLNETLFKYLYKNNYDLNINDLHMKYRQIYLNIEKAYERKEKNEQNLSDFLICIKDAFEVPKNKDNIMLVDDIVFKLDNFKKLILDYQKEIDLANLYQNRLNLQIETNSLDRF